MNFILFFKACHSYTNYAAVAAAVAAANYPQISPPASTTSYGLHHSHSHIHNHQQQQNYQHHQHMPLNHHSQQQQTQVFYNANPIQSSQNSSSNNNANLHEAYHNAALLSSSTSPTASSLQYYEASASNGQSLLNQLAVVATSSTSSPTSAASDAANLFNLPTLSTSAASNTSCASDVNDGSSSSSSSLHQETSLESHEPIIKREKLQPHHQSNQNATALGHNDSGFDSPKSMVSPKSRNCEETHNTASFHHHQHRRAVWNN